MPIRMCRVCGHALFEEPLSRYRNMPRAAQHFPDAQSLEHDTGEDLEVCQCAGCGLVQLSNDPVSYYREVIRATGFSEDMTDYRIQQLGRFAADHALAGKRIIEIGCGRGEYLDVLRKVGMDAHGLEYAQASVEHCVEKGLDVSQGFVDSPTYQLRGGPFDAFCIFSCLEHLPDCNAALQGIRANITANGVGLIEVPNFDMILRENLFAEFINDHLCYFTKETLCTTLRLNGFEVLSCQEVWHDYILSAVVRPREPLDLIRFHNTQLDLQRDIHRYIGQFRSGRIAVWGAGHQALAVLALMDMASKITYVVDSATFKQGKYTPATHLPIVPPKTLETDPVDGIIVMAASYSEEVVRTIRQDYDTSMKVAVLGNNGLEVL